MTQPSTSRPLVTFRNWEASGGLTVPQATSFLDEIKEQTATTNTVPYLVERYSPIMFYSIGKIITKTALSLDSFVVKYHYATQTFNNQHYRVI
jgi:hypothetical protein